MNSNPQDKLRKTIYVLIAMIAALVVIIGVLLFTRTAGTAAVPPNGLYTEPTGEVVKNEDIISIPGYEAINLIADTRQQVIGFPNPAQNTCYFRISLYLQDGTLLWQSGLVEPGAISDPVLLSQPLAKGYYTDAVLQYECFTTDGNLTPLNGATTDLTLMVG